MQKTHHIAIVTLFPEMFGALDSGVVGKAIKNKQLNISCYNPRTYTNDKHRNVDDRSYGGGPGMVMAIQPLQDAIQAAKKSAPDAKTVYLSPQGKRLEQSMLPAFAACSDLILVAGRYEGVDERLIEMEIDETLSIGDYVLSGGELPAMVLIDAIARLLPGTVGDAQSVAQDSFSTGLLDWPHYTRPEVYAGRHVPDILLTGDHQAIARWRLQQALGRTWQKRPDLLNKRELSLEEQQLLRAYIDEEDCHE